MEFKDLVYRQAKDVLYTLKMTNSFQTTSYLTREKLDEAFFEDQPEPLTGFLGGIPGAVCYPNKRSTLFQLLHGYFFRSMLKLL